MDRGRRLTWIFALAALAPAAALGFLGLRSLRAEEALRRTEADDQVRAFLKVAAREIQADLDSRLALQRAEPAAPKPRPAADLPDLAEAIQRERPDLAPMFERARTLEFVIGNPAGAKAIYLDLESSVDNPRTKARLLAAAARCARKAGESAGAVAIYDRLVGEGAGIEGDSPFPLDVGARLQLLSLGGDRDKLVRELLDAPLEPASELVLLKRLEALGIPVAERMERPRVILAAEARGIAPGEVAWFPGVRGLWAAAGETGVYLLHPVPSDKVRERLQELARLTNIAWDINGPTDDGASEVIAAGGALRLSAKTGSDLPSSSRVWMFAGIVAILLIAMGAGLVATLRAAQREMRLARLKSDFISGVSHELRTPLTSIRIFADLLASRAAPEKSEEHAALLKREAERLSGLVERVLDFARLDRGAPAYRLEERDLAAIVDEAVRTFRSPNPGFTVTVTRPPGAVAARVDALGIEQILHNLLDNVAKYAPERPEAEVVVRQEGGLALLEVRDRGPGIDPKDLPNLFDTFYRGRGTLETPGTGLGLAVVRQIAEAHGGRVRVENAPAAGATFTVEIPLCRASSS